MHSIKYHKYISADLNPQASKPNSSVENIQNSEDDPKGQKIKRIRARQDNLDPPPPRDLSRENLSIWIGWTYKSKRELVREAASKGHIPLAAQFLSLQENREPDRVMEFIKNEVLLWADELLTRKLINRVSTILENTKLDPGIELRNIFAKTTNADQREYIGNHLKRLNVLPVKYERLWTLLDIIIENKVLTHQNALLEDSIESLEKKSDGWREHVAAKLFLNTHDARLISLVNAEVLWTQLLTMNEVQLLITWIRVAYSSTPTCDIPENVLVIFKSFPITESMIANVANSNLPRDDLEAVLNELAKFGVFIDSEKVSFLKILSRISLADSLLNVFDILGHKYSNLPLIKFIPMLVDYCLENDLLVVLNSCTSTLDLSIIPKLSESPPLDLMLSFRELVPDFQEDRFRANVFKTSEYLSGGDLEKFFCDNPIIFLTLLVFTEGASLEQAMTDKSLVLNGREFFNCLSSVMKQYRLLSSLYFRKTKGVKCALTYLDLVEKHLKIDVRKAFAFYFDGEEAPNFSSSHLKEGFAYSKKLSYSFHLKECRPSIASKKFFLDLLKEGGAIDEAAKLACQKKAYTIALKNFQDSSIIASCVTFLELVGLSSEYLRVSVKAANILFKSGMDIDNVVHLFLNVDKDPQVIQNFLDDNLVKFIDFGNFMSSGGDFIEAVRTYDVVVKFSSFHGLPLPENFLRHLCQNNLWFPFLLYAQLKNYPIEQIKDICSNLKNPNLLEHVVHSVINDIQVDETNVLMRQRDSRNYLLSRLGVRRDSGAASSGSLFSGSADSNLSSTGSELLEIDISNTKATLLQTLIRCHNSTDPPKALLQASQLYRNPLLAILATSYEPDSFITDWLTWLAVSTDLYDVFTKFESISLSSLQVAGLLDSCMKNRFHKTLFQSVAVFIPDNPLTSFCDFLHSVIVRDYDRRFLTPKLEKFKNLKSKRRASVLSQTDYELTYLDNKVWIESTALQLLCSALIYNTDSLFDQWQFAELLCALNIQNYFSCEVPKFENLSTILKTVFGTGILISLVDFMDPLKQTETIQDCINKLLRRQMFQEALSIAKCSELNTDIIILKKWQNEFENRTRSIEDLIASCDKDFELHQVVPELVISFFKERPSIDDSERYHFLKFSHKWAAKHDLPMRYELERKKILAFAKLAYKDINELEDPNMKTANMTYKEMRDVLEMIQKPQVPPMTECNLLVEALDKGKFWLALKLERMFGLKCSDLDILKLCHELAEGLVQPHQLNEEQHEMIVRVREIREVNRRRRSLYKSMSMSSDRTYLELIEEETEPASHTTQELIHSLIEKLAHGSDLAYSIFMKYRISCNVEVPYDIVVSNTDPLKMLNDALQDDCMNKLEVVHDFLEVFELSKEQVTNFICDHFIRAAYSYSRSKIETFSMWDIRVGEQFHLILRLIKDECSTLGYKFYNYASATHQQQIAADLDFKISEMCLVVELLIAAHSCFTSDCNMEGISTVLKKCHIVIEDLLKVKSWKFIVRLFTGVGRYSELDFVFRKLKENNQFEFLLSKGSKRDERLKVACIEYLKKECSQDRELYELVAIHFNLYSEVAWVWEREAKAYIKQLIAIAQMEMRIKGVNPENEEFLVLTKSDGTLMLLNKAMEKYVLATEFHAQGGKLTNSLNAVKQAEIIALQKLLLKEVGNNDTVVSVLDLNKNDSKIAKLMSKRLNFDQSNVLAQAYNFSPDWAQILYDQAVANNNIIYFNQFADTLGLSDELLEDIARKFPNNQVPTVFGYKIIEQLESVHLKYRLASLLGFKGLVQEIINTEEISYLEDTVYKSGYKGNE